MSKTTEETLFIIDSKPVICRWVDYATASIVAVWTFIRPADQGWNDPWKVYMVSLNGRTAIPMSATDVGWLWSKIMNHPDFRNYLPGHTKMEITAKAWSVEGIRLPKKDISITGSCVVFKRFPRENLGELLKENLQPSPIFSDRDLQQAEEDFISAQEALREEHVPANPCAFCHEDTCTGCPDFEREQGETLSDRGLDPVCTDSGYCRSHS
jgi:hypothetical protein